MEAYIQESFLMEEGIEKLVERKHYTSDHLLIEFEDLWYDDSIKTFFVYDDLKRLVQNTEYQDGIEISKTCYTYDKAGEIIEEIIEVNGYLFEKHLLEKTPTGFNRKTFQDDLLIEEIIRESKGENTHEERLYNSGELIEHHFVTKFPASKREVHEIHLIRDKKRIFVEEQFDADDNIVHLKETNEKQQVLIEFQSEFQNGLRIRKTMIHHTDQNEIGVEKSEYDAFGNLTGWMKQDRHGNPIESNQTSYDEFNRQVSYISIKNGQKSHVVMRYVNL
ncbi:hypothetical protein D3C87_19310 [compost metagenome]